MTILILQNPFSRVPCCCCSRWWAASSSSPTRCNRCSATLTSTKHRVLLFLTQKRSCLANSERRCWLTSSFPRAREFMSSVNHSGKSYHLAISPHFPCDLPTGQELCLILPELLRAKAKLCIIRQQSLLLQEEKMGIQRLFLISVHQDRSFPEYSWFRVYLASHFTQASC